MNGVVVDFKVLSQHSFGENENNQEGLGVVGDGAGSSTW
jgi:hypothetical protein